MIKIIVDRETGINYITGSGIGVSGMTALLDRNGKVISENDK